MLKKIFSRAALSMILLLLAMLPVGQVFAAQAGVTFTVNSTLDQPDDLTSPGTCHTAANTCTLRAAVMQANRTNGVGATIIIPAGTYPLTIPFTGSDGEEMGDLNLTTPGSGFPTITITGAGDGVTIIDANLQYRVFHVHDNRTATISDLTIRNGYNLGASPDGGGIYNQGALTLSRTTISGNHALNGGGIANRGSLTVMNSTLSQNNADSVGGGIANYFSLVVLNSTISQNTAITAGGGIYTALGGSGETMKVSGSAIFGNGSYDGGGIYTGDNTLSVVNSTISQNYANNNGGGIAKYGTTGYAALYNTTIMDNDADHDIGLPGGVGGGIYSEAGARFIVANSLIAGNTFFNSQISDDCKGVLEAYGQNLFSDMTGCATINNANWDTIILGATIGPLQNNGGPTWIHALLPGSQAIDNTKDILGCVDETGAPLTTDQRGFLRPVGVRCDVGAFEYSPPRFVYLPLVKR
jgi:hypothetical protein